MEKFKLEQYETWTEQKKIIHPAQLSGEDWLRFSISPMLAGQSILFCLVSSVLPCSFYVSKILSLCIIFSDKLAISVKETGYNAVRPDFWKRNGPIFGKLPPKKLPSQKCQNIYIKAQFVSPRQFTQNHFEILTTVSHALKLPV